MQPWKGREKFIKPWKIFNLLSSEKLSFCKYYKTNFLSNFFILPSCHRSLHPDTVRYPTNLDLSKPDTLGLYATRSFHVNYEDEDKQIIRIACWHVLPNTIAKRFHKQLQLSDETLKNITNDPHYKANYLDDPAEARYKVVEQIIGEYYDSKNVDDNRRLFEEILRQTHNPICLYIHGNTGSRANGHRVEVYKTLRRLGYHVIAIDYRGFADSSDVSPTERGCVADALAVYSFIKNLTNNPVFVYGHSLGLCYKINFWHFHHWKGLCKIHALSLFLSHTIYKIYRYRNQSSYGIDCQ